jgi:hypothetical protein
MLGGYTVRNRIFPTYAVSYEGLGKDFAALVLAQGRDRLKVAMINLAGAPREGAMLPWQLDHGEYELAIGPDADDDGVPDRVETTKTLALRRLDRIPLRLPPRRLMLYELTQKKRLDDLLARPDLAISREDVIVRETGITCTVHNIGSAPAHGIAVALVDGQGKQLAEQTIARLDAPLDLIPRTAAVTFPSRAGAAGVVIDPADAIPEITEGNNAAGWNAPP